MGRLSRGQRRKQKLRRRDHKEIRLSEKQMMQPGSGGVSIEDLRKRVSDVTHQVVTEETGDDGAGSCMLYAAVGMFACRHVFGGTWHIQAGTLALRANPDSDFWFGMDPESGDFCDALGGEFHCWIANPVRREFVDLSSRHYRHLMERVHLAHIEEGVTEEVARNWLRIDPPEYLWVTADESWKWPIDWVRLIPHPPTNLAVLKKINEEEESYERLWRRVWRLLSNYPQPTGLQEKTA